MTGSGLASGDTTLGVVQIECRTTNSRGLSIKTRLHGECQGFDAAVEAYLRTRIQRGSVLATVSITEPRSDAGTEIDAALAARVAEQLRSIAEPIGVAVTLADVLVVPGVLPNPGRSAIRVGRSLPEDVSALVRTAVDRLIASREAEGAATVAAVVGELDRIDEELAVVVGQVPHVAARYRERLLERVNEFLEGRARAMQPEEVIREVAVFADRVDVAEEIQRLGAHLRKVREVLAGGGSIGRTLEFLVQEMLREVNTLGSKTPDADIAHRVVTMKSCIDKLKEQSANLV